MSARMMFHMQNKSGSIINFENTYGYLYNQYVGYYSNYLISGMRMASSTDFQTLGSYLTAASIAGGKLKEIGTTHWASPNTSATDIYKFSGLPGGKRYLSFEYLTEFGFFWTTTYHHTGYSYAYRLGYNDSILLEENYQNITGLSIRCVRDLTKDEQTNLSDGSIIEYVKDYDDNYYQVRKIGSQGWCVGNLKTTHTTTGVALTKKTDQTGWTNAGSSDRYYCAYNNDESYV